MKRVTLNNCEHGVIQASCTQCHPKAQGHTPGPWHAAVQYESAERAMTTGYSTIYANNGDGDYIGQVLNANARLIAAAPELLDTLKRIASMDVFNDQAAILARNEARDAIVKAEGDADAR